MTAVSYKANVAITINRSVPNAPILISSETMPLGIRAGTEITVDGITLIFEHDLPVDVTPLIAGTDYALRIDSLGKVTASVAPFSDPLDGNVFAGFHYAPGGNAVGCAGGDTTPAINQCSFWDVGFRPACADPRGMALVSTEVGAAFWADIYLLGTDHRDCGTSRHGATITDGYSRPQAVHGEGRTAKLDYPTAVEICAHHGKRLMTAVEFFAAAYGVKERSSIDDEPDTCGLDAERTSRFGLMQATGNMWVWGTDGHPDDPRPAVFGGSWFNGSGAGSRSARLGYWPENSNENIGVRAASDHLNLA